MVLFTNTNNTFYLNDKMYIDILLTVVSFVQTKNSTTGHKLANQVVS